MGAASVRLRLLSRHVKVLNPVCSVHAELQRRSSSAALASVSPLVSINKR